MAKYTVAIRDICEAHADEYNINTMAGLEGVGRSYIFGEELEAINEQHRSPFVAGFMSHYFNDEICMETLANWKISCLKDAVYNNAAYVNQVMDNIDKNIFSAYRITKEQHQADRAEASENIEASQDNGITAESDNRQNASAGSTARAASDMRQNVSNISSDDSSADSNANASSDIHENFNKVHGGGFTDISSQAGSDSANGRNTSNSVAGSLDTPQGSLSNMRNPNIDTGGLGVGAVVNAAYNYLSGAATEDGTQTNESITANGGASYSNHATEDTDTTDNGTAGSEYSGGSSHIGTANTQNTGNETGTSNDTENHSDNSEDNGARSSISQSESGRSAQGARTSAEQGNTNREEYELNWELFNKIEPLMNRIWRIFDDIFLGIM